MGALTLHSMDDNLVMALHRHAAELGTSLNQAAKSLLSSALGLIATDERKAPGFMKFAGTISSKDAESIMCRFALSTGIFAMYLFRML